MTTCQAIVSPTRFDHRVKEPKYLPSVLEPTPGQFARLDAVDRDLLGRVLREPVEYMDAPALHESDAERALFGARASRADKTTRFAWITPGRRSSDALPSAAQERLLFQQFNYARMRREQLLRQFRYKRMPVNKLRLLLAWVHREMDLRNQIVELNMPLVLAMVGKFRRTNLNRDDLVSEGSLALLRCVNKFDCSRGFKFSTYACRAILKSCSGVSLRTSRYTSRFPASYDPALDSGDLLEREHENAKSMCMEEVREILAENRAELSDREKTVMEARFMLWSDRPDWRHLTLAQVGEQIGITKERVRQIQNRALRKLRDVLEDSFLRSAVAAPKPMAASAGPADRPAELSHRR